MRHIQRIDMTLWITPDVIRTHNEIRLIYINVSSPHDPNLASKYFSGLYNEELDTFILLDTFISLLSHLTTL